MPICRNPELIRSLLMKDEPGTRSLYNLAFGCAGARASWIRVDDPDRPRAVICRSGAPHRGGFLYLYATSNKAAAALVGELPRRWRLEFAATPQRFVKSVRKHRKLNWVAPCYLYVLNPGVRGRSPLRPGSALGSDPAHRVGRLRPGDAPLIAHHWPHGKSVSYVQWRIGAGPSCAIRRGGKLVAWALTHADGSMAILHVLEAYRGQGMARSITAALVQRIVKWGLKPFLFIVKKNQASISLTESMGFRRHGVYCWFGQ
jgi:ribosomal protein S18 acetylase RimI-like enzyme